MRVETTGHFRLKASAIFSLVPAPNRSGTTMADQVAISAPGSATQPSGSISAPVSYELTCEGGPDPFFSAESWRLTSANLGVLVNGSDKGAGGTSGIPVSYSGVLVPGDEYTLTLQETAGFTTSPYGDSGGLQVDFTVPESAPQWLLGWGLGGVLALRMKRWRKSDGAAESARENRP